MKPKPRTVFWGNARVSHRAIIEQARDETVQRLGQVERYLLVQDTVSLNFSQHPATSGLGVLENQHLRGFMAHSTLAVSVAGVPLGLVEQHAWARDPNQPGVSQQRQQRAFADKESHKWVKGIPDRAVLPDTGQAILVCDAEAHIYEYLDVLHTRQLAYIVRAADYRGFTSDGQALFAAVASQPVQHTFSLSLQRLPQRAARSAQFALRFATLSLRQPQRAEASQLTLTVQVVDVHELHPPPGHTPIHWLLLTSLPVTSVEQAQQIVTWYSYRWLIERLHYVLKSGCKLEDSQLRQQARLARLLAVYSLVAWRLLWLTYQARVTPDAPCSAALQAEEWHALYRFTHRTSHLPATPPSLRLAVRWLAQLGGFLGRAGDGDPGVKVLWRGWSRLQDIIATFTLFHSSEDVGNV